MASIYPSAYILYILYIPYLAAASLNVSFRLKRNRHHTTKNSHTTTQQRFQSYVYVTNHYKQFRKTRKVPDKLTHVRRHFIEKTLESLLLD